MEKYVAPVNDILKKFNVDYGFSTTGYVDVFKYDGKKNTDLYAWISISSYLKTSSKLVELEKKALAVASLKFISNDCCS